MFKEMLSRRTGTEAERDLLREMRALWIPTFRHVHVQIEAEIRRARRYERPLTLGVISMETGSASERLRQASHDGLHTSLDWLLMGLLLREEVRETDLVSYAAAQDLYAVLMLETREDEAALAMERLGHMAAARLGCRVRTGVAEFPRDGLTVDDLFERAVQNRGAHPNAAAQPLLQEVRNG